MTVWRLVLLVLVLGIAGAWWAVSTPGNQTIVAFLSGVAIGTGVGGIALVMSSLPATPKRPDH